MQNMHVDKVSELLEIKFSRKRVIIKILDYKLNTLLKSKVKMRLMYLKKGLALFALCYELS